VADGVYAFVGDIEGRSYENEGLNTNIGLVVTPAGAVLIDSGSSYQVGAKLHEAVKKVTTQPLKLVINTGDQDHRWLGNGYFAGLGIETLAHANGQADMKARAGEHLEGLKVLKERLSGTQATLPSRFVKDADTTLSLGGTVIELKHRQGGHTWRHVGVAAPNPGGVQRRHRLCGPRAGPAPCEPHQDLAGELCHAGRA
jgi:glyoxylase-like metal-dependent hydrolase (beta-lactamase superfamily II)